MRVYIFLSVLTIIFSRFTNCRMFSRCELAKEFLHRGISKDKLNDWVCLVESESGRDTQAINKKNSNKSWDYGLFQLNSMYWCQGQHTKSNGCAVNCNELINNSLDPSYKCAMKVFAAHGFSAWYGWQHKCKGKAIGFYTGGCNTNYD